MLYTEAKRYLLAKLKAAGLKSKPYTTQKSLEKSLESHIGAVIFERESYARNGSKKRFRDEEGAKHKRRRIFDRDVTFVVTIGDYTDEAVESMLEQFVSSLDAGFLVDGNFVPVVVEGADWVDKDDSILKAQVAVQVSITFRGGIYRDTDFGPLSRVELTGLDKKTGKENTDVD
ncbi:MAG: SON protein [Oscillibacter sp.]|nr:SON protein [Oscillibacter sp.]